jgi:asparagine synthase (glutamine-hydrolysing)
MCGIAGYIASDLRSLGNVQAGVLESIRYRGRDDEGGWSDGTQVYLFNTRLSIIDLALGHQPMHDASERFTIIFNGAVYNYKELKAQYEAAGAQFRTHSDTEVIVAGFALKGEKVLDDLNGMFAFAIWDRHESRLFLGRDRLGKKPLYWTMTRNALVFSSTLETFRGIEGWDSTLSTSGLVLFSFLGGFPVDRTAYKTAFALPPASFAWFSPGQTAPRVSRYWLPHYATKSAHREGALIEEYGALLADAVRIRLRSDVPVALSFSGGTDSGTIAALAKKNFGVNLSCYTIDYDSPGDPSEEVAVAAQVASRLGLDWTHIQYDYKRELLEGLDQAYTHFDQPCQQLPLVYSKRLYDEMKKHCTVVLSGNGADELFTGYNGDESIWRFDRTRRVLRATPDWLYQLAPAHRRAKWDHVRLGRLSIPEWARGDMMGYVGTFTSDPTVIEECRATVDRLADEYAQAGIDTMLDLVMHRGLVVSAADTNYRLPDITGYAAQVEVRSPFLDHRIVEFAARLPHSLKVGSIDGQKRPKYLARKFYERFVGPQIAWGNKRGMGANLRWDRELSVNREFRGVIADAYRALDNSPISAIPFRRAYETFNREASPGYVPPSAGTMMNGFMLGAWLQMRRPLAAA